MLILIRRLARLLESYFLLTLISSIGLFTYRSDCSAPFGTLTTVGLLSPGGNTSTGTCSSRCRPGRVAQSSPFEGRRPEALRFASVCGRVGRAWDVAG